jgi:hypothetical protein
MLSTDPHLALIGLHLDACKVPSPTPARDPATPPASSVSLAPVRADDDARRGRADGKVPVRRAKVHASAARNTKPRPADGGSPDMPRFNEHQLDEMVKLLEPYGVGFRDGCDDGDDGDGYGVFRPYFPGKPFLFIYRPRSEYVGGEWEPNPEQLRVTAVTFLHEFGHVLSWSGDKERWKRVHRATCERVRLQQLGESISAGMLEDDRRLIFDEEETAWRNGREHAAEGLLEAYDARAREMLDGYRSALFP